MSSNSNSQLSASDTGAKKTNATQKFTLAMSDKIRQMLKSIVPSTKLAALE
jgi:hypothetical protein